MENKTIPREGYVLLSRKNPFCAHCEKLENVLKNMKIKYQKFDVVEMGLARMGVPVLYKDGNEILNGMIPDVEKIKKIL